MMIPELLVALLIASNPATDNRLALAPVTPSRVLAPFREPQDDYAPGHRGADLIASAGQTVRAPMSGTVTFTGSVAGRPIVVIADGNRMVTLEPVRGTVAAGQVVAAGARVGVVGTGGHCSRRCLHLGLRVGGAYVDPLRLRVHLVP